MDPYLTYLTYRTYLTFKTTLMTQTSKTPTISTNDFPPLRHHRLRTSLGHVTFDSSSACESTKLTRTSASCVLFQPASVYQFGGFPRALRAVDLFPSSLLGQQQNIGGLGTAGNFSGIGDDPDDADICPGCAHVVDCAPHFPSVCDSGSGDERVMRGGRGSRRGR